MNLNLKILRQIKEWNLSCVSGKALYHVHLDGVDYCILEIDGELRKTKNENVKLYKEKAQRTLGYETAWDGNNYPILENVDLFVIRKGEQSLSSEDYHSMNREYARIVQLLDDCMKLQKFI